MNKIDCERFRAGITINTIRFPYAASCAKFGYYEQVTFQGPRHHVRSYYWTTPNGHKITIFLEETQLPYVGSFPSISPRASSLRLV